MANFSLDVYDPDSINITFNFSGEISDHPTFEKGIDWFSLVPNNVDLQQGWINGSVAAIDDSNLTSAHVPLYINIKAEYTNPKFLVLENTDSQIEPVQIVPNGTIQLDILEDNTYGWIVTAVDNDGDIPTYSTDFKNDRFFFNVVTGEISFTPNQDDVGSHEITIELFDAHNKQNPVSEFVLNLTVLNVNDPPSAPEINRESSSDNNLTVKLIATPATDEDGETSFEYQWDMDGDGTTDIFGVDMINVTYTYSEPGTYNVKLTVTDSVGSSSGKLSNWTTKAITVKQPENEPDESNDKLIEIGPFFDSEGNSLKGSRIKIVVGDNEYEEVIDDDGYIKFSISDDDVGETGFLTINTPDGAIEISMTMDNGERPPEDWNEKDIPEKENIDDDDDPTDKKNDQKNKWILPAIAIAITIVVVLVLLLFVFKKGKKPEIPQQESIPHSQRQRPNPKMQTQPVQMMPARSQPVKTAPVKTPVRATKPPTQTQVAVQMTKPIENQVDWEDDLYGGL